MNIQRLFNRRNRPEDLRWISLNQKSICVNDKRSRPYIGEFA